MSLRVYIFCAMIVLVSSFVIVYLYGDVCIAVSKDTYYWVYSTIAQLFAALLALFGVFVVYRLQDNRITFEKIRNELIDNLAGKTMARVNCLTSYSFMSDEKLCEKAKDVIKITGDKKMLKEREKSLEEFLKMKNGEKHIKDSVKNPIILSGFMIIFSLALLPFGEHLRNCSLCMTDTNFLFLSVPILLSIITTLVVSNSILEILNRV